MGAIADDGEHDGRGAGGFGKKTAIASNDHSVIALGKSASSWFSIGDRPAWFRLLGFVACPTHGNYLPSIIAAA